MKEWVYGKTSKELATSLADECGIEKFTAFLLLSNGISDPFMIDEYLSDDITLQDPCIFADIQKAADRINDAIENGEKIAVFGDYDCDGITSTVLMYSVLNELGADCIYRLPNRDEGYGMSVSAIDELHQEGVKLIITVDNGITAFKEIDYAKELGIEVVVTDHHLPTDELPNAFAVVDPKRKDCPSEFKDYAGVGVAFMLCCLVSETSPEDLLYIYGDLVAIGTIADIMPLKSDNRTIVKHGLKLIKKGVRRGLNALIDASGLAWDRINSSSVAFTIAPRINATGRVYQPTKAVELLLCEDIVRASELAEELCELNNKRRELEMQILNEALEIIKNDEKMLNSPVIVVGGEDWHSGVIGIVAARLCNIFSRPAVVFSLDENYAQGSARSCIDASIYDILSEVSEYAESFGGHSSAAGITVKREDFEKVASKIQYSAKKLYEKTPFDKLNISCKLNPNVLSINNAYFQMQLEPFGEGNERPVYVLDNMYIVNIFSLSMGKHLKLILSRMGDSDKTVEVVAFSTTIDDFAYKKGDKVDVAVTLDVNVYNEKENLSIVLKDIRPSEINQESLLSDIREFQNFKYFGQEITSVKLDREDVVKIYKQIRIAQVVQADEASLQHIFKEYSFLKLRVILEVLKELGFIQLEENSKYKITCINGAVHRDLSESVLFKMFS
ncbi:MAG: single-stranded-DNA-specific exonuclease RecJ [Clostridia bacterium]|nr:single-stranded-DNA-specific exonuclease RecJ [Clostridia bacterium]